MTTFNSRQGPPYIADISLKAKYFKCFGEDPQGFDRIKPINIIIGRNNSGKSSLLDMVQYACRTSSHAELGHKHHLPEIQFGFDVSVEIAAKHLSSSTEWWHDGSAKGSFIPSNWVERTPNRRVFVSLSPDNGNSSSAYIPVLQPRPEDLPISKHVAASLSRVQCPLRGFKFRRLSSERDITEEKEHSSMSFDEHGDGITNFLRRLCHVGGHDHELVETRLPAELNSILCPDIDCQRLRIEKDSDDQGVWQILVYEPHKGFIPISQMGSGFKTVLLVLANLLLIPAKDGGAIKDYIFAFEELENNLHPSAQRRLFQYLREYAEQHSCHFFITTHSNVVIDMFTNDTMAQLIHVHHSEGESRARVVNDHMTQRHVLEDLGVRASDLLQTNCVVWVEGPSDRIYFKRWLEVLAPDLMDGVHFHCLTYAGSLNKHFSFDETFTDDMISALRINQHAIFIADSDRSSPDAALKKEVIRLSKEVREHGIAWVTAGKEVENYIPEEALQEAFENPELMRPNDYEDAVHFIREQRGNMSFRKVEIADLICPHITREGIESTLDLAKQLKEVITKIRAWNDLPTSTEQ